MIDVYKKNFSHQPSYNDKLRYIGNFRQEFNDNEILANIRYVDLETYMTQLVNKPVVIRQHLVQCGLGR